MYRIMNDGCIKRMSDLAIIPPTEENPDYVQFLKDKEAGATVKPYDYAAEDLRQRQAAMGSNTELAVDNLIQEKLKAIAVEALIKEGKLTGVPK